MRESYIFQPGGQTFSLIYLIKVQSFFIFDFFVRFIKVPNFRILQFLKYFLSKQVFLFSMNYYILINNGTHLQDLLCYKNYKF